MKITKEHLNNSLIISQKIINFSLILEEISRKQKQIQSKQNVFEINIIFKNFFKKLAAAKNYSSLLTDLRKDVESFNVNYTKYNKSLQDNKKKKKIERELNNIYNDLKDDLEEVKNEEFNIDDFLNPKKGSKNWLEEQPEKIRVLIEEKKYQEAVLLIKEIRNCELELVNYETKMEIDKVYNFMIEKLTVNISVKKKFLLIYIYL